MITIITTKSAGNRPETEYKVEIREGDTVLAHGVSIPAWSEASREQWPTSEKTAAIVALKNLRDKLRRVEEEMKKCGFITEEEY